MLVSPAVGTWVSPSSHLQVGNISGLLVGISQAQLQPACSHLLFLDIDLRYYCGEHKKTNEEISYLIILFFLEQNINSLQYITHRTILAMQIMNHEIAAHRVKELLSKSSG